MADRIHKVSLDSIAKEKLANQIIKDIESVELEIWESAESGLSLEIGKKTIRLRLNLIVPTKKFLAWFGGITATASGIITALKWLVPILAGYFVKPP